MRLQSIKRSILAIGLSAFSLLVISCAGKNQSTNQNAYGNANVQVAPPAEANNRNVNTAGESGDASSDEFEGTAGIVVRKEFKGAPALLHEIRTAEQDGFDRVVFEFEGNEIPNYKVEYIDKPIRQCGSGNVAQVAGDGWLEVEFKPANAHSDAGQPTIVDRERRLSLPILKELEITCDFEAEVVVVVGVSSPNRYRVLDLHNPTRVVVDIKHKNR